MSSREKAIVSELRTKHKVDDFFYPDISMNIQIPDGLQGEVSQITEVLRKNKLSVNSTNVLQVMKLKRKLLREYSSRSEHKKTLEGYQKLLKTEIKPVGSSIPIEIVFINGLVVVLLSIIARFGLSFADEAGKIAARKLLGKEKSQAKKHNMSLDEYRFVKNAAMVWIEEGKTIESFAEEMRTSRRWRRRRSKG